MSPLAQIAVAENGYSAEITLTKKQAAEVKIGDIAEVTSSSLSTPDVTATVETIRDNISASGGEVSGSEAGSGVMSEAGSGAVSGTGGGKIVVLRLEGEVSIGESLNFTLKRASNSYDVIVPHSAVRTDSEGTFILTITEKSTPLGTRYLAERINVEVIDSDDNNSAVSGAISDDSIITTSSKSVEPGDYVRLADKG